MLVDGLRAAQNPIALDGPTASHRDIGLAEQPLNTLAEASFFKPMQPNR
jgi:hypothetical protein